MTSAAFALHPQLAADTLALAEMPLCRLLLMNDARYPWCILVPRRPAVSEIHELSPADRQALLEESVQLGRALMSAFDGHKLNVAALGNVVPQLHVHHIVRFEADAAWPAPVWGRHPPLAYPPDAQREFVRRLRPRLPDLDWQPFATTDPGA
ncbi:HIT domain-containing protein [Panacagrimonas sp.]|uniref:HIT domain-containing protein n=1 Tax=Panacagrimonas sp. TaxID=2480088 RepID=UPI003B5224DC